MPTVMITTSFPLQPTIAAATSGVGDLQVGVVHHPITCSGRLFLEDNGVFGCEHGEVPPGDLRTQASLNHSMALLLIEEAYRL